MQKILIPFDGSDNALRAVRYAASIAQERSAIQLELLNVQPAASAVLHVSSPDNLPSAAQLEEAESMLGPAREILEQAGLPYQVQVRVGPADEGIAEYVNEAACDAIVMGTRGMSPVASLMIGSTAMRVIHLVNVPVTLIK